ncbi:MAG TPA: hypothetical protein VEW69_04535 [Alphaproteobacteria bacterium]|nr:hypothetical protein [Alphaproteobacteria bacterium]
MNQQQSACQQPPVFEDWMNQWKLNALDAESSAQVLHSVLDVYQTQRPQDHLWKLVQQFVLDASAVSERSTLLSCQNLVDRVNQLTPVQARVLLSHLAHGFAFERDTRLFWSTVRSAIGRYFPVAENSQSRPVS